MAGENTEKRCCRTCVVVALSAVVLGLIAGGIIWMAALDMRDATHGPQYSMAITGVAGLDLDDVAGDRHPTLSPVFNLTLRISNNESRYWTCVPELAMASVSYRDAFLGKGSVGPFCAEPKGEREGRATVWGQDVAVPRFLRDQLAGDLRRGNAAVDVVVKMPSGCNMWSCFDKVLLCRPNIRGGLPCWMSVGESQH